MEPSEIIQKQYFIHDLDLLFAPLRGAAQIDWKPAWGAGAVGTVMLPKTCRPESPLDLRPITILSRIYRQWRRYKAVALLVELSKRLRNVIPGGSLKGCKP